MIAEIPVTSETASMVVQLGEVKYRLDVRYNDRSGVWTMDVIEAVSQLVRIRSMALVLGQALFEPFNFDMGRFFVVDTSGRGIEAGPDDLGVRVKVFWFSEDELA